MYRLIIHISPFTFLCDALWNSSGILAVYHTLCGHLLPPLADQSPNTVLWYLKYHGQLDSIKSVGGVSGNSCQYMRE